jgi:short-subunit dehydrogenase
LFNATETSMSSGTALITGASSGIGAIYADRLARRGHDLILVARNRERLDARARRLSDDTGRAIKVIVADLNDKADLAQVEQVLRSDATITVLVNNAGIEAVAPLVDSDIDEMKRMNMRPKLSRSAPAARYGVSALNSKGRG